MTKVVKKNFLVILLPTLTRNDKQKIFLGSDAHFTSQRPQLMKNP